MTEGAPYVLHRIPEALRFHDPDITTRSGAKRDRKGHCCVSASGQVPIRGLFWPPKNVSDAKGVSTFSPFDDLEASVAAHRLFDRDGSTLACCIFSTGHTIDNMMFVYDRDFPAPNYCAHHVLISPSTVVDRAMVESIALCQRPQGEWFPCPHMLKAAAESGPIVLPEPPDDSLLCLACNVLEEYALDVNMAGNQRRAARLGQFRISTMEVWEDLQHDAFLCSLVEAALLRLEDCSYVGFSISTMGMLRGMLASITAWSQVPTVPTVPTYSEVGVLYATYILTYLFVRLTSFGPLAYIGCRRTGRFANPGSRC